MPSSPGIPKDTESDEETASASILRERTRREWDSSSEDDDTEEDDTENDETEDGNTEDEDIEDDDIEDDEISEAAPTERKVILAGLSGHLDNLTRPVGELEMARANSYTGGIPQRVRYFCALVYFCHHDILREDIQELFHKPPNHSFMPVWMEAACMNDIEILQTKTLTYVRELVKEIYKSKLAKENRMDITRLPVAKRKTRIWIPLWRRRGLEIVKGMFCELIRIIDFEIIMRPPTNLTKGLSEKLQHWRTYLMLCFCLAAEASCKLELLSEVRPKAIVRAPRCETVLKHWKRLPLEDYIHVPDLDDLPVFERMHFSKFSWKQHEIGCPSGHSFLDTTDMVG